MPGRIGLPPNDPTLTSLRAANAIQAERILQLEAVLAPRQDFSAIGHLIPQEATILAALLQWETASHEHLYQALYAGRYGSDTPDENIVKVNICRLRAKLATHGVTIGSWYRVGYRMAPEHKSRLRALMAGPVAA